MNYQPSPHRKPALPEQRFGTADGFAYADVETPRRPRKKWPWIVGGIVVAGIFGCAGVLTLGLGGAALFAHDRVEDARGQNAVAGRLGQPSTDGKFQFTVHGLECGVAHLGSVEFGEQAQGQFCLLTVSVKNVGTSAEVFSDMSQRAYDAKGAEYAVDSGAGIWANKDYSTFLESINPGNTVEGKLVYDVPAGTRLTSVLLHESMFTAGVRIPLA